MSIDFVMEYWLINNSSAEILPNTYFEFSPLTLSLPYATVVEFTVHCHTRLQSKLDGTGLKSNVVGVSKEVAQQFLHQNCQRKLSFFMICLASFSLIICLIITYKTTKRKFRENMNPCSKHRKLHICSSYMQSIKGKCWLKWKLYVFNSKRSKFRLLY